MDHIDVSQLVPVADFETEALEFLPNVARYARLLTRDQADADDLALAGPHDHGEGSR